VPLIGVINAQAQPEPKVMQRFEVKILILK